MSGVVRYSTGYRDVQSGTRYRLDIVDMDGGGPYITESFDLGPDGVTIKYNGDTDNPFEPIIPMEMSWLMDLDTATHLTFYTEMIAAYQGRFVAELYTVTGSGLSEVAEIYQRAIVIPNLGQIEDSETPTMEVRAVCGLATLKTIKYDQLTKYNKHPYLESITIILLQLQSSARIQSGPYRFVDTSIGYKSVHHDTTIDTINLIRLRNIWFNENEETGVVKYDTCYDVLEEILLSLNARIFTRLGYWHIEQLGEKVSSSEQYDGFNKSRNRVGRISVNNTINVDSWQTAVYPMVKHLPALRQVELTQRTTFLKNLAFGTEWGHDLNTGAVDSIFDVGQDNVDDADRLKISINIDNLLVRDQPYLGDFIALYEVIIHIDNTQYLGGTAQIFDVATLLQYNYNITTDTLWTTTINSSNRLVIGIHLGEIDTASTVGDTYARLTLITPPVPIEGDLSIEVQSYGIVRLSNSSVFYTPGNNESYLWRVNDTEVGLINYDLEQANRETDRTLTIINDVRNTAVDEIRFAMGDYPDTTSMRKLEVFDGTAWVDSTLWTDPSQPTREQSIEATIMRERIEMRSTPQYGVSITFDDPPQILEMVHRISYGSNSLIPLEMVHRTGSGYIEGYYWRVGKAVNNDTVILTDSTKQLREELDPLRIVSDQAGLSSGTGSSIYPLYYSADDIVGSTVTVSGIDLPTAAIINDTIRRLLTVTVGGIEYRLVDTISSDRRKAGRQVTTDTTNGGNDLIFGRALTGQDVVVRQLGYFNTQNTLPSA